MQQTKQLADSARMDGAESAGEARKQRLRDSARSAAGGAGAREVALIPASEIALCKRPDGSDFALGEGASVSCYDFFGSSCLGEMCCVLTTFG
jgi:hypothetical protein